MKKLILLFVILLNGCLSEPNKPSKAISIDSTVVVIDTIKAIQKRNIKTLEELLHDLKNVK